MRTGEGPGRRGGGIHQEGEQAQQEQQQEEGVTAAAAEAAAAEEEEDSRLVRYNVDALLGGMEGVADWLNGVRIQSYRRAALHGGAGVCVPRHLARQEQGPLRGEEGRARLFLPPSHCTLATPISHRPRLFFLINAPPGQVLSVSRTANDDEIKRSYRKLALRFHVRQRSTKDIIMRIPPSSNKRRHTPPRSAHPTPPPPTPTNTHPTRHATHSPTRTPRPRPTRRSKPSRRPSPR